MSKVNDSTSPNRRVKVERMICKDGKLIKDVSLRNLKDRATKYEEDLPERLGDLYKTHRTKEKVCAHLGISESTYYLWLREHPDFKSAHEICITAQKAKFLDYMQDNFENKNINTALVIFYAKAYFKIIEAKDPEDEEEKDKERQKIVKSVVEIMESLKKVHDKPY